MRTPLLAVDFPPKAKVFFNNFVMITNFDILPSSSLNQKLFGFSGKEYNERFSGIGYDSVNAVDNVGSFLYYLIIITGLIVVGFLGKLLGFALSIER